MNSSPANRVQPQKSCGNAGSVERVENQTQVFHSSHRPLEISPTPRDFHIPTAQAGRAWKSGKPKSGFPLSHTRPATMTIPFKTSKSKPNLAASGGQRTNQRRRGSRRKMSSPYARLPGSPRTGNETHFQAHSALEINIDFRLTFGLENASATRTKTTQNSPTVAKPHHLGLPVSKLRLLSFACRVSFCSASRFICSFI